MLELSISCTRFETNYSSCTSKSNENICSSSGGAQEKGKKACKISVWQNSQFRLELVADSKEGIAYTISCQFYPVHSTLLRWLLHLTLSTCVKCSNSLVILGLTDSLGLRVQAKASKCLEIQNSAVVVLMNLCLEFFMTRRRHLDDLQLVRGCVVFHFHSDTRERKL